MSTSKIVMKTLFDAGAVSTAPWAEIPANIDEVSHVGLVRAASDLPVAAARWVPISFASCAPAWTPLGTRCWSSQTSRTTGKLSVHSPDSACSMRCRFSSFSCGITDSSIVWNATEAIAQAMRVGKEFGRVSLDRLCVCCLGLSATRSAGWFCRQVYCEKFVKGREFTALVVGDAHEVLAGLCCSVPCSTLRSFVCRVLACSK